MAQQIIPKQFNIKKASIIASVLLFVFIGGLTTVKQIGTGQIGVVTRYGRVTGKELGEGLHFILPFGIEKLTRYDIKVQKQTEDVSAASKDLQDVGAVLALNYRIEPNRVSEIHRTVGVMYSQKLIDPALQEVFKAVSAQFSAQELITKRAEVKNEAYQQLKTRLEKYGIVVDDLSLVDFKFSNAFSKAIEEKQVAQQNAERAKFNLESARIDAEAQKVQADTLSDSYLRKLAIEKWNGQLPSYLGQGTVFNIPLR